MQMAALLNLKIGCNSTPFLWLLVVGLSVCATRTGQGQTVRFDQQIRPLFAEKCLSCHGPDSNAREADLRLDDASSAKGSAIVAGDPESSELWIRVTSHDPAEVMPPPDSGQPLDEGELRILKQWIREGATYEQHWAFEPIQRVPFPVDDDQVSLEIDRFIHQSLRDSGLQLSPRISKRALIRRASIDLTGLPPTWDEVDNFVTDDSEDAFERVLDRLLDSPRYGERWGRYWLDLARYADTHGGSAIGFTKFPFSYTYRDYVIDAFNRDLPYPRFVMEQLAADQLGLPQDSAALAGLGFLTIGMQFRNRHDLIDDQIDVVSRGLLGLTVACARCHDHKYDPIPSADYYSLYATFAPSSSPELLPLIGQPSQNDPAFAAYQKQLSELQTVVEDMARDQGAVLKSRLRMQVGLYLEELAQGAKEQDLAGVFLSYRTDDLRPAVLNSWLKYLDQLPQDDPVFGPWFQLIELSDDDPELYQQQCQEVLAQRVAENGDPAGYADQQLGSKAPRWNPRVLEVLQEAKPRQKIQVARAYGQLFATVNEEWMRSLLEATLEAAQGAAVVPDEAAQHATVNSAVNQQLRRHLFGQASPIEMSDSEAAKLLNRPIHDNLNGKRGAIHGLHLNSPGSPPRSMALSESYDETIQHIFRRGNPLDRGEEVAARFLSILDNDDTSVFPAGQRRLSLAQSIVREDNPLTRRVIVNWVWQHHFGQGLVKTADDFGTRGSPPSHPELLDYLAESFRNDGWSLKQLHKRIMLSGVYQQGAIENADCREVDPNNELLWRFPRTRLDLESMRDSMLWVSGELDDSMGGRPFDFLASPTVARRSVYGFINRDIISPLSSTFDAANPNACTVKRPQTMVPQKTLFALNSAFIQDRALAFANLAWEQVPDDSQKRIRWMYRRAFCRDPEPDEIMLAETFLLRGNPANESEQREKWAQLGHVLLASNEFVFVD
jgi:cytochrome c553